MFNKENIKKINDALNNSLGQLKRIEEEGFPDVLNQANKKLSSSEKALFQEFAKEAGKIMSEIKTKSPEQTSDAFKNLALKYEQRNTHTPGI